ncbi:hypothetical protein ABVT39_026762 [Epinephelus coioides]
MWAKLHVTCFSGKCCIRTPGLPRAVPRYSSQASTHTLLQSLDMLHLRLIIVIITAGLHMQRPPLSADRSTQLASTPNQRFILSPASLQPRSSRIPRIPHGKRAGGSSHPIISLPHC